MSTDEPSSVIGRRLREVRVWRGLSLRSVAELSGLSASYLSLIERGRRPVERRSMLEALAAALRVAPSELGASFPDTIADRDLEQAWSGVTAVEQTLTDIELGEATPGRDPITWEQARVQLVELERRANVSDFPGQAVILPGLVADLNAMMRTPEHRKALVGLCVAYHAAAAMVRVLGVRGLPTLAAWRLQSAAEALADPAWLGLSTLRVAFASGRARSIVVADRGISALGNHLDDRRCREMAGMLHLVASLAESTLGRPDRSADRLDEAGALARDLDDGLGFGGMMFGPSNVQAWRVTSALEQDPGRAVDLAEACRIDALATPSRQAEVWADLGRGLAMVRGRRADAVTALRTAEELAPVRIRAQPLVRETVTGLLQQARRDAGGRELRGMAYRMGLAG